MRRTTTRTTEDADSPARPNHDVSYLPSYPLKSTRSGLIRNGGGGNSAMPTLDEAAQPPIAFLACLLGGIQLSQLPDPRSVREAMASPDANGWKDATDQEMANLKFHDVYELVPRMNVMRTLKLGWAFHWKFKKGVFENSKGRLVARGNQQRPGVDLGESLSPLMRLESLHTILAIHDIDIIQFDITSTYLHGTLKEELYVEQPEGYVAPGKKDWVWRLKKGLYGLVQAGRTWYEELNAHMESEVFTATAKDPAIYVKNS